MILIVCIDDKRGMMFNRRRQSKDSVLRADVAKTAGKHTVWMDGYSAKQFTDTPEMKIKTDDDFLKKAGKKDFCFAEKPGDFSEADKIIVYRWNRMYPADAYFDVDLSKWKLVETCDFAGSSHEKITKEVYKK